MEYTNYKSRKQKSISSSNKASAQQGRFKLGTEPLSETPTLFQMPAVLEAEMCFGKVVQQTIPDSIGEP
jgi:hypothetical protein